MKGASSPHTAARDAPDLRGPGRDDPGSAPVGRCAAIVPAAGRGERLGPGAPKALRTLAGVPVLVHAVRGLLAARRLDLIVVVAPAAEVASVQGLLAGLARPGEQILVVPGGASRQESVASGLAAVPADIEIVLVHDAARALTPAPLVAAVLDAVLNGADAVIPVLPVADTIKSVDDAGTTVTATVDRSKLRAVQTPQGFRRSVLAKAHASSPLSADGSPGATDDAGMVESLGLPVAAIPGHVEAFKVTTPFDLVLAEAVLAARAA
jgi:2-C-methyl-D-erythritol 4-phosphate cytidylyltransferase